MRYGKYLIVTLPDFRRHFDFRQFLKNRREFVRDMHPDKVYYWGDSRLMDAYHVISRWIVSNPRIDSDNIPGYILETLKYLVGKDFRAEATGNSQMRNVNFADDIINLSAGQDLLLPVYDDFPNEDKPAINLHRIAVEGEDDDASSVVRIGEEWREVHCGDALYVTECGGRFIDFSSNHAENEFLTGRLIEIPGRFGSLLVIADKAGVSKLEIDGVLGFVLSGKGYIYVNESGKLISIDNDIPMMLLRMKELQAVQIKSEPETVKVLYSNGVCRASDSPDVIDGVKRI